MIRRGIITLVFDDGYQHILDHIVPLLDHHHIPGVFAIPLKPDRLRKETGFQVANYQDWQQRLASTNHELAAHSITHRDLTTLTPAQLQTELADPAHTLSASTLVYPGGAYTDTVVQAAKPYYQAARTVRKGLNASPPSDPMRLKSYNFTKTTFSPTRANVLALWAYVTNSWLIETYHLVTDQPTNLAHTVTPAALDAHLAFLKKLPIETRTIRDTIQNH